MQGFRKDNPEGDLPACGQYGQDRNGQWFAMTPNGHLANLTRHNVQEHADGTITVTPSILITSNERELWHGFLAAGQWRPCGKYWAADIGADAYPGMAFAKAMVDAGLQLEDRHGPGPHRCGVAHQKFGRCPKSATATIKINGQREHLCDEHYRQAMAGAYGKPDVDPADD